MTAASNHKLIYATVRGGVAIENPAVGEIGTAGLVATSDGGDRWIISCHHVLCRRVGDMPAEAREPIYYAFDRLRRDPVAIASAERADRSLDCAAALVPSGRASGRILGIGRLVPPLPPRPGMRVLKSGGKSGVTEGVVLLAAADEVEIGPPPDATLDRRCYGEGRCYELCEAGDSGAVWVDADTLAPVALHYRGDGMNTAGRPEHAFGRPIIPVLAALRLTVFFGT